MFNPMIVGMPTRGSNDNIISLLIFIALYFLLKRQYILAGLSYGLSVHFKIYPIIYSFALYFFIDMDRSLIAKGQTIKAIVSKKGFFTKDRLVFTFVSAGTFIGLTTFFYLIYGYEFLYEAYLYHFIRKDHRHNNSVYFYMIYQLFDAQSSTLVAVLTFLPQWLAVIAAGFMFYYDLWLCLLVQTWSFVIFNKVMTA
jgi:phosphatidylinositol glycan class M